MEFPHIRQGFNQDIGDSLHIIFPLQQFDGLVKVPTPALRCILQSFNVRQVRLMIAEFARLEFELFTRPSKFIFLKIHQQFKQP
jgi:hypothetical protein